MQTALASIGQLASSLGISPRGLHKRAQKEQWNFVKEPGRSRRGFRHLYQIATLPPDIRRRLGLSAEDDQSPSRFPDSESPAAALPEASHSNALAPRGNTLPTLKEIAAGPLAVVQQSPLSLANSESARQRLNLVRRFRQAQSLPRGQRCGQMEKLAAEAGVSLSTLYTWSAQAAGAGEDLAGQLICLSPGGGGRRGPRNFDLEPLVWVMTQFQTQQKLTLRSLYYQLEEEARAQGWRIGSYRSLSRWINELLPPSLQAAAREGLRSWEAAFAWKTTRRYDDIPPNFCWVGDHHIFDVFVKVRGRALRPWLTAWMDARTRCFVGYAISLQPSSDTIISALRHGILPKSRPDYPMHGMPSSVYIDNGKDYKALDLSGHVLGPGQIDYPDDLKAWQELGIDPFFIDLRFDPAEGVWRKDDESGRELVVKGIKVGGVFARIGAKARFATAYHPWAKPIERAFRNVVQQFSRQQPGWCGTKPSERPEKLAEELKSGRLLTLEQFSQRFEDWLCQVYHAQPHNGHGMERRSPLQAWQELAAPVSVPPEALDFALRRIDSKQVTSSGIRFSGTLYQLDVPNTMAGAIVLNQLIGRRVELLYDPKHLERLRVYYQGRHICDAVPKQLLSYRSTEALRDHQRLVANQRKAAKAALEAMIRLRESEPEPYAMLPKPEAPPADYQPEIVPAEPEMKFYRSQEEHYIRALQSSILGEKVSDEDLAFMKEYEASQDYLINKGHIMQRADIWHEWARAKKRSDGECK